MEQLFNSNKLKKPLFLAATLVLVAGLNIPNQAAYAEEETNPAVQTSPATQAKSNEQLDKQLSEQGIDLEVTNKWLEKEDKNNPKKEKKEKKSQNLIHNNGKPIETDLFEENPDGNVLVAVYQDEIDGDPVEKYYFSNKIDNNIDEIESDAIEIHKEIKNDPNGFIKKMSNGKKKRSEITTVSVQSQPAGGWYKIYSWNFYNVGGIKSGSFESRLNLHRVAASANINGKTGSVWDIHAFNQYEVSYYRINQQTTRMDVDYSAQEILSYGPYDDAGFDVSVNLSKIASADAWSFNVGSVYTNNVSSLANKYGRWIWTCLNPLTSYMQNPFATQPGMRVSNTSGPFSIRTSHTLVTSSGVIHSTGVITTTVPDR